jgi:hypothetical protein
MSAPGEHKTVQARILTCVQGIGSGLQEYQMKQAKEAGTTSAICCTS